MPCKGGKKANPTLKSQSIPQVAGEKRKSDEAFESRPAKYRKTNTVRGKCPGGGTQDAMPGQPHHTGSNKIFRFLDLPAEIRNQIYEVIAEMSDKSFPHIYPNPRLLPKGHIIRPTPKNIPFIGLTQTCISIRKEFRPMWLSTHLLPLYSLAGYFKAFFPLRVPSANPASTKRLTECYHNRAGTLKVRISNQWPIITDLVPFLKFRLRFPEYNVRLISTLASSEPEFKHSVDILLNNDNTMWMRYIEQHIITQVLLRGSGQMQRTDPVRIVIKERHAPDWMKKYVGHSHHDIDTYAERLGLEPIRLRISFGVDYS